MALQATFRFLDETRKLGEAALKAQRKSLAITAARTRKTAVASVHRKRGASPVGTPPHTHRGAWLRRAIRFQVDNDFTAVVGPMSTILGEVGRAHEFGGRYKGSHYPRRPFMGPALRQNIPLFAGSLRGTIGQS